MGFNQRKRQIMKSSEALQAARKLIEKEENWCQIDYAQNSKGVRISSLDPSARRFCAMGSIYRVAPQEAASLRKLLRDATQNGDEDIVSVNEKGSHADVISVFDRAIELAECEERDKK
jgi:hypothetical protein